MTSEPIDWQTIDGTISILGKVNCLLLGHLILRKSSWKTVPSLRREDKIRWIPQKTQGENLVLPAYSSMACGRITLVSVFIIIWPPLSLSKKLCENLNTNYREYITCCHSYRELRPKNIILHSCRKGNVGGNKQKMGKEKAFGQDDGRIFYIYTCCVCVL
jgi:hypothetical protein